MASCPLGMHSRSQICVRTTNTRVRYIHRNSHLASHRLLHEPAAVSLACDVRDVHGEQAGGGQSQSYLGQTRHGGAARAVRSAVAAPERRVSAPYRHTVPYCDSEGSHSGGVPLRSGAEWGLWGDAAIGRQARSLRPKLPTPPLGIPTRRPPARLPQERRGSCEDDKLFHISSPQTCPGHGARGTAAVCTPSACCPQRCRWRSGRPGPAARPENIYLRKQHKNHTPAPQAAQRTKQTNRRLAPYSSTASEIAFSFSLPPLYGSCGRRNTIQPFVLLAFDTRTKDQILLHRPRSQRQHSLPPGQGLIPPIWAQSVTVELGTNTRSFLVLRAVSLLPVALTLALASQDPPLLLVEPRLRVRCTRRTGVVTAGCKARGNRWCWKAVDNRL